VNINLPLSSNVSRNNVSFSKILVAIDGSEESMDAADYAFDIARMFQSQLIVALHIIPSERTIFGPYAQSHIDKVKEEAQKYLDNVKDKANKRHNNVQLQTQIIASPTSVVAGIVTFAEKENVDLIVIGTKGKSAFKKLLLGSVAEGVVTYAHCPVLAVR
jgi:nucleotide-binding universal stress UspA family protein